MLHGILNFLKEYSFLPISVFSFLSVLGGVAFATRSKLVLRKTKLEVEERIKIESRIKIIQAIKGFPFAVNDARIKICNPLFKVFFDLNEVKERINWSNVQQADAIRDILSDLKLDNISNECERIEKLIVLLEYDLTVNGEDKLARGELDKLEIMLDKIRNMHGRIEVAFGFIVTANNRLEVIDELESIMEEYSLCGENDKEEVKAKAISDKLAKIYMEKINESA